MYEYYNPNPLKKNIGDCTVRALTKALDLPWECVYAGLCAKGFELCDMPDSNNVWGEFLIDKGFKRHIIPETCPMCFTVGDFAQTYNKGIYVLGTGKHAVTIVDGCIYDSFDSSDKLPVYYFKREDV